VSCLFWNIIFCIYYPIYCSTRKRKDATTIETSNDDYDSVSIQETKDVDDDLAPPIDYSSDGEDGVKDEQKEKVVVFIIIIYCLFITEITSTCYESVLLFTYTQSVGTVLT
jgi:hypothetical protein